ncbi:MAG: hypothetical protein A2288_03655 [Candidatus Moranbacteria bacterium RIFOXYA12_FULL_44_15]|nr:MAG: hypothetical protein A2288_03655 [Candidatus Moranbacteria bacterium RIFOXYA12_FULL_44_15]OGI36470.1 MAG: hypothetical protein A2259_01975 [Candidatus Moranbacteria bacterium RIFOXYA2_FULL_43_15]
MKKKKVLVVDDEESIREMLGRALDYLGVDVALAKNGAEALACLEANPFELLITDNKMPVMIGLDLIQLVRSLEGDIGAIPIIFMSGDAEDVLPGGRTLREVALSSGANIVLDKPLDMESFLIKVLGLLKLRCG